jgi:hypothetical protein
MRYALLLPFALIWLQLCASAQDTLADYQKKVEREEWDEIYSVKSRTPITLAIEAKETQPILDAFMPLFKKRTPAGSKLVGDIKAFKNWALFTGYSADPKGNQITPKDGIASDTTVLFLKTREGWTVVDYGLGHSDMFYIIWPAQYGVPVELLDPPKAEQAGTGQPATRPESKSEVDDKPQPETEGRSR